jgi:hypothetical protein
VRWTLNYAGPRSRLIILKPTFPEYAGPQVNTAASRAPFRTYLGYTFFTISIPEDGRQALTVVRLLQDRRIPGHEAVGNADFVTVEKGQSLSEIISLPASRLRAVLEKEWPRFNREKPPPRLYLQMHHLAGERGERIELSPDHIGLDAWTGDLESRLIRLELSKW